MGDDTVLKLGRNIFSEIFLVSGPVRACRVKGYLIRTGQTAIFISISLSPRSSHVRLCLRSSVKAISAISTSIRKGDRMPSA